MAYEAYVKLVSGQRFRRVLDLDAEGHVVFSLGGEVFTRPR
jgi:hypothetical protein